MRKLYLLIIVALIASQADAQFIKLTRTQYSISATDTTTVPLIDSVYNISSTPYLGKLAFGFKVLDSVIQGAITDTFDFAASPLDTFGTPNGTRRIDIHIPYNNPYLIGGPTGVVIWPIYTGGQAGVDDTIRLNVTVTPTGLEEVPLSKMYITQLSQVLNIHFGENQNIIQQVSLYNIEGRLMFTGSADHAGNIPTSNWSAGLYFCEIKTYKGERRTIKFLLQ